MILDVVVVAAGAALGGFASRRFRRPDHAANAASVARSVSGSLGRRRGLTPPELQRACFSEMVRHVQVDRSGRTLVPSRFVLRMHPDDVAIVAESRSWFIGGLISALDDASKGQGWVKAGDVEIDVEPDPSRRPGVPRAMAVAPGRVGGHEEPVGPPPASPSEKGAGSELVVERSDTAERVPLGGEGLTIGRSRDRDLSVNDSRVSRAHAHIEQHQRGWVIIDDGSANGTTVDGKRIEAHHPVGLRNGSVIGVGPVELRVRSGSWPSEPATRALDDSDRHRVSREYLKPGPGVR